MKKNKFRSGIAVIAAALTLSQGTGLTASAESYQIIEDPFTPGVNSYVYVNEPYSNIQEPVRYYESTSPKRVNSAADAKKAGSKTAELLINSANFPDAKFRAYVSENFDTDNSGGLSETEIDKVNGINVDYLGITTLKGIEHFPKLRNLNCAANLLTSIDVSQNTALTGLSVRDNKLTRLDVSNNTVLNYLDCRHNNIASLDVSKNTALGFLDCIGNRISSLNLSQNTELYGLTCGNAGLTALDLSNNMKLTNLFIMNSDLVSLDVSSHTALERLTCRWNEKLASLNVSGNTGLKAIDAPYCSLDNINTDGCTGLKSLVCEYNMLKSLDISSNTALEQLKCERNFFSNKSDIIGLNEEALTECEYAEQYYEGFKYRTYDVTGDIPAPTMPDLNFSKVITHKYNTISYYYPNHDYSDEELSNMYAYTESNCEGIPENIVTSDGIVFVPMPAYKIPYGMTAKWSSSDESKIRVLEHIGSNYVQEIAAYEPGEYTLTATYTNYYVNGEPFYTTKEYKITAINIEDHTSHEYPDYYNEIYTTHDETSLEIERHAKQCFCGERTDSQPHTYGDVKIIPYVTGTNIYRKFCTECSWSKTLGGEKSKTLTDEATGTKVTDIEGSAIPDGTQLYVTDVTAAEKPNLKNVSKVYNISLQSGGVEQQPNGDIAVTIPVPLNVNGEKAKVYRKEANGTFTDMKAVYNPRSKTLTFVTNHLSIYAITGGDVLLGDVNGDGKINNTDIILLGRSYMAGTWAQYLDVADMNDDNNINNTDIILLGRLYMSMSAR